MDPEQFLGDDAEHTLPLLLSDRLVTPESGDHILDRIAVVFIGQLCQSAGARLVASEVRRDDAHLLPA